MDSHNQESSISSKDTSTSQNAPTEYQEKSLKYFPFKRSMSQGVDATFILDDVIADSIFRLSKIKAPRDLEVVFNLNKDAIVHARRDIVCCLMRNLITNIVQFGSNGEKITISSEVIQDKVIVSIFCDGGNDKSNNFQHLLQKDKNIDNSSKVEEIIARIELLLCRQFAAETNSYLSVIYGERQDTLFTFSLLKSKMNTDKNSLCSHLPTNSSIHWHSNF